MLRTFCRPGLGRSVIWEKILPNSSEDEFLSFCVKPSPGPCGLSRLSYLSSLSSSGKGFTLSKPLSPGPPTLSGRNHFISKQNYLYDSQTETCYCQTELYYSRTETCHFQTVTCFQTETYFQTDTETGMAWC